MKINKSPTQPEQPKTLLEYMKRVPKWGWVVFGAVMVMFMIVSCAGGGKKPLTQQQTRAEQSSASKQASIQADKTMELVQQKYTNTAQSMLEQIKQDPKKTGQNSKDMDRLLTTVFTTYQNVPKKEDAYLSVRAKKLAPYFTKYALNQLIPVSSIKSQKTANIIPQSELTGGGGISVNDVKDVKGAYVITVLYKSFADGLKNSTSTHRDQYLVTTNHNQITNISQVSNSTDQ